MDGNSVNFNYSGTYKALVVNNKIEDYIEYKKSLGYDVESADQYAAMIQVRIPALHDSSIPDEELPWAAPCMPFNSNTSKSLLTTFWEKLTGADKSTSLVPDEGDIVWITYEGGNKNYPVYYGIFYRAKAAEESATDDMMSQSESSDSLASLAMSTRTVLDSIYTSSGTTVICDDSYTDTLTTYIEEGAKKGIADTKCLLYYAYMRTAYGSVVNQRISNSAASTKSLEDLYDLSNELADEAGVDEQGYSRSRGLKMHNNQYYKKLTESSVVNNKFTQWVTPGVTRISSGYGQRTSPSVEFHHGIDIAGPSGTPEVAVDSGVITYAQFNTGGFGYCVIMKLDSKIQGQDTYVLYGHGSSIAQGISVGARVIRGQTLMYMGSTGYSTGNHLHFQVMLGSHTGTTADNKKGTIDPESLYDASTIK